MRKWEYRLPLWQFALLNFSASICTVASVPTIGVLTHHHDLFTTHWWVEDALTFATVYTGVRILARGAWRRREQDRLTEDRYRQIKSAADELKLLADLHAVGILTDDEFAAKKTDLLESI